ncbi:hypothetical protein [Hyphobacterium marinum]|uniref:Uncharacterized protein n=1 Tax=Hyphobacterium marinum TaxID=3116574 RepID=A0ABU7LYU2_9PROT|nr:hypothetical protein [Hyphobacterium sp. Y6023]MEE2566709.1 hypothetical protein [Hyphobacterium sp. Y6023]
MTLFEHNHSIGSTTARIAIFFFAAWFFIRAPLVGEILGEPRPFSSLGYRFIDFPVWLAVSAFAS